MREHTARQLVLALERLIVSVAIQEDCGIEPLTPGDREYQAELNLARSKFQPQASVSLQRLPLAEERRLWPADAPFSPKGCDHCAAGERCQCATDRVLH